MPLAWVDERAHLPVPEQRLGENLASKGGNVDAFAYYLARAIAEAEGVDFDQYMRRGNLTPSTEEHGFLR